MRKKLSKVIIAALTASLLFGCGKKEEEPDVVDLTVPPIEVEDEPEPEPEAQPVLAGIPIWQLCVFGGGMIVAVAALIILSVLKRRRGEEVDEEDDEYE